MSDVVISVQDLEKRYRLGVIGGGTLGDEITAWLARLRGRPDPRLPIEHRLNGQRRGEYFWALRNVSFDVHRGEVLGVIGRNGAGKSTLLKLLSRITAPTNGVIRMKGRVSSLLEVGTGFNPELTGRENIYLNGAILGMRKAEIDARLDEIISFSGIEYHIDSPVKRYSSGMKVRLGFAVAAHLEPEILIVDEVLAVGDADFQRKCMGRMKDVASGGRTILFVSHNMAAVKTLCTRTIWMEEGRIKADGPTDRIVSEYMSAYIVHHDRNAWTDEHAPGVDGVRLRRVSLERPPGGELTWRTPFRIAIEVQNDRLEEDDLSVGIHLFNEEGILVFGSSIRENASIRIPVGTTRLFVHFPGELLNVGDCRVAVNVFRSGRRLFTADEAVAFHVQDTERSSAWFGRSKGVIRPVLHWSAEPA